MLHVFHFSLGLKMMGMLTPWALKAQIHVLYLKLGETASLHNTHLETTI